MDFPKIDLKLFDYFLIVIDSFWHNNLNDFPLNYFYPDWLVNLRESLCNYIERDYLNEIKGK